MVYSRNVEGETLSFGISGRLYKSNVLLYDHQSESLWSQLMSKAIAGPKVGTELVQLPSSRMPWLHWRQRFPHTQALSEQTGFVRNYRIDPYKGYYRVGTIMFPVGKVRKDLSPKARVLGVAVGGQAKAYALKTLQKAPGKLHDRIGSTDITIEFGDQGQVVDVSRPSGELVAHMFAYWFAWQAFYPETQVHK